MQPVGVFAAFSRPKQAKIPLVPDQSLIVGWSNIKVMGTGRTNRRPIVELDVCPGGKKLEGRVNLTDRSAFLYPVLIGRNLLITGKFLVDPGAKYLQDPGCQ